MVRKWNNKPGRKRKNKIKQNNTVPEVRSTWDLAGGNQHLSAGVAPRSLTCANLSRPWDVLCCTDSVSEPGLVATGRFPVRNLSKTQECDAFQNNQGNAWNPKEAKQCIQWGEEKKKRHSLGWGWGWGCGGVKSTHPPIMCRLDSPVTSGVWSWSPSGPQIPARGCATSGTGAPRLAGPVPSRRRPPRATRPGGWGAGPCSLSTTARIVSTPPYRLRRTSSQSGRTRVPRSASGFAGAQAGGRALHGRLPSPLTHSLSAR